MESTAQTITKPPAWMRWLAGGVVTLLCVAGLAWTGVIFSAEYRFRSIPNTDQFDNDKQFLTQYAISMERLLAQDPTNGELRNTYASLWGKLGDYERAISNLRIAMRTHNTQNSLFAVANMYEKMGDIPHAEAAMAECLKINPVDKQFNPALLGLLNKHIDQMRRDKRRGVKIDADEYARTMRAYGEATTNWMVRAPHDMNSYLFLGNYYIEPLYPLQAYRCYLIGLSRARWLNLNTQMMITPQAALGTVQQILQGNFAKPYRNLP